MIKTFVSVKKLREFGVLIGFGFPILIGWILPALNGHDFRVWTIAIGIPSLFLGFFKPKLLSYPYSFWMKLGEYLGWVNSRIILGIIFIIILNPIAFIMKLLNYDPLRKKWNSNKSYRESKKNVKVDLTRIF